MRWPLGAVLVAGPSMAPTLWHGDALVVWRGWTARGPRVRSGDLVVARFPDGPDRLVVKRAERLCAGPDVASGAGDAGRADNGGHWWLVGDNRSMSDDSRTYGPGVVVARVLCRYWPPRRSR